LVDPHPAAAQAGCTFKLGFRAMREVPDLEFDVQRRLIGGPAQR
jgi:hypothetical protein